ncbi:hypothetical protein VP01_1939g4 [Puccinia sorghi]|uniref:Uncharacterized protein n=1 Tax=Puccinia sorghi TaxID=27349 RepID=A0A0L6VCV8_9BASI|nr:hypothetical protein VP01_1939g4 [Puccinia sorghi]
MRAFFTNYRYGIQNPRFPDYSKLANPSIASGKPPPLTSSSPSITKPTLPGLTRNATTTSLIATTICSPAWTSNFSSQLSHTNNTMSVYSSGINTRMVKKIEEQEILGKKCSPFFCVYLGIMDTLV